MITQPVTFVIGAGASKELGLPLGTELRDNIAHDLREFWKAFDNLSDVEDAFQVFVQMAKQVDAAAEKFGTKDLVNFGSAFERSKRLAEYLSPLIDEGEYSANELNFASERLIDGLPSFTSVDDFLAVYKDDLVVSDLTKAMINLHIREASRNAIQDGVPNDLKWISVLWRVLSSGAKDIEELKVILSKVKVINFNYDLTFEYGIYRSIADRFIKPERVCLEAARALKVIHPYGNLFGRSDNTWDVCLKSTKEIDPTESLKASEYIKTIHEGAHAISQETINEYFKDAHRIVFIGFGFHSRNLDLIDVGQRGAVNRYLVEILFSHFGLSNYNAKQIKSKLSGLFPIASGNRRSVRLGDEAIEGRPETASDFLENISFGLN